MKCQSLLLILLCVMGCGKESSTSASKATDDADLTAVKSWLRDHLDDPKYEEVKWWPAVDTDVFKKQEVTLARVQVMNEFRIGAEDIEKNPEAKKKFAELQASPEFNKRPPTTRVARLKYRTKNKAGANQLNDVIFVINGSRAAPLIADPREREQEQLFYNQMIFAD